MSTDTRERMVAGAADLIRRRGLRATSLRDVVAHSQTPRGSLGHYFPDGKDQLAKEAVLFAGREVEVPLERELRRGGPLVGLQAFLALWREVLVASDYQAGCAVLAAALEEYPAGDDLLTVADQAFRTWEGLIADSLREHGVPRKRANSLATLIVASVEGSVGLCRARCDAAPLDQVEKELTTVIAAALAAGD